MTISVIGAALLLALPQEGGMAGMKMAPAASCPATPAPLPADLAAFATQAPITAGASTATAPALTIGSGARVTLGEAAAVRYAVAPGHVPPAGSHGGLVALTIAAAGRYRVALGAGAWIDVVGGDKPLASVAHAPGPACSPVRKTVDFDLAPGRYLIQLSGNAAPAIGVLVLPVVAAPAIGVPVTPAAS